MFIYTHLPRSLETQTIHPIHSFFSHCAAGDVLENLQTPLLDITNRKLGNPSLECCMLHSADECEKERMSNEMSTNSQSGFDSTRWEGGPQMDGARRGMESPSVLALALSLLLIATTNILFY